MRLAIGELMKGPCGSAAGTALAWGRNVFLFMGPELDRRVPMQP
jgi:hypothetical protein